MLLGGHMGFPNAEFRIVLGAVLVFYATGCGNKVIVNPVVNSGDEAVADPTDVLTGKEYYNATGSKLIGTMPSGANVTGANGAKLITLDSGYYDGTKSLTVSDTNLVANKIKSGISIFGVVGSANLEIHPACTANGQSGCLANASYVAGVPRASFAGANAAKQVAIPQGYYDGSRNATVSDTNLVALNILKDVSLFGVTGTGGPISEAGLVPGQEASASHILKDKQGWDKTGALITGTMEDRGTLNASVAFAGAGYYSAISNAPSAGNICSGASFNGVAGTAVCNVLFSSNMPRDKSVPAILPLLEEQNTLAAPAGYRDVPIVASDDEGYGGGALTTAGVSVVRRTSAGAEWEAGVARNVCGKNATTVYSKLADCDSQHAAKPAWDDQAADGKLSWNGEESANLGQGSWTLVTVYSSSLANGAVCDASCYEVWRDDRTGLLWSSKIARLSDHAPVGENWCRASGNAEADDATICGSTTYQPQFPTAESVCAEGPGLNPVLGWCAKADFTYPAFTNETDCTNAGGVWTVNTENYGTGIYHPAKGGMGANSVPAVQWRLPTRDDFLIAEVNGIRMVLPGTLDIGNAQKAHYEWTATVYAADRTQARSFMMTSGGTPNIHRTTSYYLGAGGLRMTVRCVGR